MSVQSKTIISPVKIMMGNVTHEVTVRSINNQYHCRVFTNGVLNQEAVCFQKLHISATCRDLLRWEDKLGNISNFASSARNRNKK